MTSSVAVAQSAPSGDAAPPPVKRSGASITLPSSDMQAVLTSQRSLGGQPVERLTPAYARMQVTPSDGVRAVMSAKGLRAGADASIATRILAYGTDYAQKARIYTPAGAAGLLPVVVYYHGGGWVLGDLDSYDATPRALVKSLRAIVVSVEYRKAPEWKFPAQHEDALAAYRWVLANARSWGGDTSRVALAGESAGGNLAVATAIAARDASLAMPRHILSIYPIAATAKPTPSREAMYNAAPLNTPMLDWFAFYYRRDVRDASDPRLNLVGAHLSGLPPVTIINAQIDPLLSDGEQLADALRSAKVDVEQRTFAGATHEFFGMAPVVSAAVEAQRFAVSRLAPALKVNVAKR